MAATLTRASSETDETFSYRSSLYEDSGFHAGLVGSLSVHSAFQAIVDHEGNLIGHEALLRARTYAGGELSAPAAFHLARFENGLIELDRLSRTIHIMNYLRYPVPDNAYLFLNVNPGLVAAVQDHGQTAEQVAHAHDFPRERIVIEITENASTTRSQLEQAVAGYRQRGFLSAIDDFGSERSNLDRLWTLKPDFVKLDGRLFREMASDPGAYKFSSGVLKLVQDLGAAVIVEGIETADQAEYAKDIGAEYLQGYFFDRPGLPARQI